MQTWKPYKKIPHYEVSEDGQIRNSRTGRILKTNKDDRGYVKVCLHDGGKQYTSKVSRIVADTYYDGYDNGMDVTFKDGDRSHVHYTNLEYKSRRDNVRSTYENGRQQLHKMRKVRCVETEKTYESIKECAMDMGVSRESINKNINGRTRHTVNGYHFEHVE